MLPAWRFLNLVHVTWRRTLPLEQGREGMFTQDELDKSLAIPFTQTGEAPAASVDEPDEWTVEGLEPPPWWRGDEEASMSGLQVRSA